MSAKLVVTARKGGSRIALVGASGKELLTSVVFTEPRAKGATIRSLKGLLGEDIVVEDHTLPAPRAGTSVVPRTNGAGPAKATKPAAKATSRRRVVRPTNGFVTKAARASKAVAKR